MKIEVEMGVNTASQAMKARNQKLEDETDSLIALLREPSSADTLISGLADRAMRE